MGPCGNPKKQRQGSRRYDSNIRNYFPNGGSDDQIRTGDRVGGARTAFDHDQGLLRVPDAVWSGAEYADLPDMPGTAGRAAGAEQAGGGICRAGFDGAELPGADEVCICAEELLLSRFAERLPDFAVRSAAGGAWLDRGGVGTGAKEDRNHAAAHGRGRGEESA